MFFDTMDKPPCTAEALATAVSMLCYAMSSYQGSKQFIEHHAKLRIEEFLVDPLVVRRIGKWELVWGPFIKKAGVSAVALNSMYLIRSCTDKDMFICGISGTNPFSIYSWIFQDADVFTTVGWGKTLERLNPVIFCDGAQSNDAEISRGCADGLRKCIKIKSSTGETLPDVLLSLSNELRLLITGHSLGGALAPVVALYLHELFSRCAKHIDLFVYPIAGVSPGNEAFKNYYENALGEHTLDIVPNAWDSETLQTLTSIYEPTIKTPFFIKKIIPVVIKKTSMFKRLCPDQPYFRVQEPSSKGFIPEVAAQHSYAYLRYAEITDLGPSLGRAGEVYKALFLGEGFSFLKVKCSHQVFSVFKSKSSTESKDSEELQEMREMSHSLPSDATSTPTKAASSKSFSTPSSSSSSSSSSLPENEDKGTASKGHSKSNSSAIASNECNQHTTHRKKHEKHKKAKKHSSSPVKSKKDDNANLEEDGWVVVDAPQ